MWQEKGGATDDNSAPSRSNVVNLMEALKRSVQEEQAAKGAAKPAKATEPKAVPRRAATSSAAGSKGKRPAAPLKKAS